MELCWSINNYNINNNGVWIMGKKHKSKKQKQMAKEKHSHGNNKYNKYSKIDKDE